MENMTAEIARLDQRQTITEQRINEMEGEVKDIRQLTTAVVQVNDKVDRLKSDMNEIKGDVKGITSRPGRIAEKILIATLSAVSTGLVVALLAVVMK